MSHGDSASKSTHFRIRPVGHSTLCSWISPTHSKSATRKFQVVDFLRPCRHSGFVLCGFRNSAGCSRFVGKETTTTTTKIQANILSHIAPQSRAKSGVRVCYSSVLLFFCSNRQSSRHMYGKKPARIRSRLLISILKAVFPSTILFFFNLIKVFLKKKIESESDIRVQLLEKKESSPSSEVNIDFLLQRPTNCYKPFLKIEKTNRKENWLRKQPP